MTPEDAARQYAASVGWLQPPPPQPGVQPLTPEELAIGQQIAAQDVARAQAAAYGATPQGTGQAPAAPPTPSLDWQPPAVPYVDVSAPPAPPEPPRALVQRPQAPRSGGGGGAPHAQMLREQSAVLGASQAEADRATADVNASVEEQARLAEEQGYSAAGRAQERAKILGQRQAELEQAGAQFQAKRDARQAEADRVAAEYRAHNEQANQVEIRDRRTTGQRVMGALAVVLSGLGDAVAAGGNVRTDYAQQTLAMIDDAIERDLEIQRANLENKRASAAAKFTELGLARQSVQDVGEAEALARASLMDKYAGALERAKEEGAGDDAVVTSQQAAAQLRGQAAQIREQRALQRADKAEERTFALQSQVAGERARAAAANRPMGAREQLELEGKMLDNERKRRELGGSAAGDRADIPGYERVQDVAPGDAALAKKTVSAARSLRADLQRLTEIRAKNQGGTWNRNDVAEANQIVNGMAPKYSQMFGSGAPSTTELELFKSTLVNPTDYQFFGLDPTEAYQRAAAQIERTERDALTAYGYRPAGGASDLASLTRPGSGRAAARR